MKKFSTFVSGRLAEAKEGKNAHLEHMEDEVINKGSAGAEHVIEMLDDLAQQFAGEAESNIEISVKFDGAPAIICGRHPETKKFFVGTKGVFAKDSKACYNAADVRKYYQGDLGDKLIKALTYLPDLDITGVIQGDYMFTREDLQTTVLEGQKCYIFRPNTITYAVPVDSKLGLEIEKAQIGIVFHTTYVGETIEDMHAEFGMDVSTLTKSPRVWFIGATYKDETGVTKLSADETTRINAYLNMARGSLKRGGKILDELSSSMTDTYALGPRLKVYFNSRVRTDRKFVNVKEIQQDFEEYYIRTVQGEAEKKSSAAGKEKYNVMAAKGQEFFDTNRNDIYMAIATYCSIHNAKNLLINKLNKIDTVKAFLEYKPGQYKVTAPEGFVAIKAGKAMKLVDRFNFSAANFNMPKNWG